MKGMTRWIVAFCGGLLLGLALRWGRVPCLLAMESRASTVRATEVCLDGECRRGLIPPGGRSTFLFFRHTDREASFRITVEGRGNEHECGYLEGMPSAYRATIPDE